VLALRGPSKTPRTARENTAAMTLKTIAAFVAFFSFWSPSVVFWPGGGGERSTPARRSRRAKRGRGSLRGRRADSSRDSRKECLGRSPGTIADSRTRAPRGCRRRAEGFLVTAGRRVLAPQRGTLVSVGAPTGQRSGTRWRGRSPPGRRDGRTSWIRRWNDLPRCRDIFRKALRDDGSGAVELRGRLRAFRIRRRRTHRDGLASRVLSGETSGAVGFNLSPRATRGCAKIEPR